MIKKISLLIFIIAISAMVNIKTITRAKNLFVNHGITTVFAEDDGEDEKDDEDEKKSSSSSSSSSSKETYEEVVTPPVVTQVPVVPVQYTIDSDGDGLVDGIDPNPTVPESQFFTDDDNDGVANFYDLYPGDDDFKYIEFNDVNNNGIEDAFENLK